MTVKNKPYLSVILPVYNESKTLPDVVSLCVETLKNLGVEFEIIIVNDSSLDDTDHVVGKLMDQYNDSEIRFFRHPYNKGNGATVKTGIRAARGEWVCCMDADGQHDPKDLVAMMKYFDQYDLIVGARPFGSQMLHREFANQIYNRLASWVTSFPIEDLTSGFRIFRATVIKRFLHLFPTGFSYPTTSTLVMLKMGYNVKYIPINIRPRLGGKSKVKLLSDGLRFLLIILKIMLLFDPIRIFLIISITCFLLSIVSFVYSSLTIGALYLPNSSVLLMVVGVLILALGFISEQITTIQLTVLENKD